MKNKLIDVSKLEKSKETDLKLFKNNQVPLQITQGVVDNVSLMSAYLFDTESCLIF